MKRLLYGSVLLVLLPMVWRVGSVDAAGRQDQAHTQDQQASHSQASQPKSGDKSADYVGSETCLACHEDITNKFATNPHSRLALLHGGKGVTCESCHGPGREHVEGGGDITKIFRFTQASAKQVDKTCLGCHASAHPNFERSAHGKAMISCTSCHSIHKSGEELKLLKASEPGLCYSCHTDQKPVFDQPFHHRVNEGLMKCSDCHNPHGTFQNTQLKSTHDQNAICTKCHTETAGPFVYEHPVVKTEGCTVCHSPHGSPNPRLLNVANVNTLCLQCHSETNMNAFPHAASPAGPTHNQATQYVVCINCHTQIHGSNASGSFMK